MHDFSKTISGMDFYFKILQEGTDTVFRVNVDNQNFRMILDDDGNWGIWQQVPAWILKVEEELSDAIAEQYPKVRMQ